ncbi:unnamed protein product, partial [Prorocentrum cordatum]
GLQGVGIEAAVLVQHPHAPMTTMLSYVPPPHFYSLRSPNFETDLLNLFQMKPQFSLAVRVASQDVHHRKTKVQKLEEQLVEAREFLATDTAAHEKAAQCKRDADEALQIFNEEVWMEEKRKDQRRAREIAEAARGPPQGAEVHGGGCERPGGREEPYPAGARVDPESIPSLGDMDEAAIRAHAVEKGLPLELLLQFQKMSKKLAQDVEMDAGSDACSDAGDLGQPEADELRQLRRRACETALGADGLARMEALMSEKSKACRSQLIKTASNAASARIFCQPCPRHGLQVADAEFLTSSRSAVLK